MSNSPTNLLNNSLETMDGNVIQPANAHINAGSNSNYHKGVRDLSSELSRALFPRNTQPSNPGLKELRVLIA